MNCAELLDNKIKLVCPIIGISIGNELDKNTWKINFDSSATSDQINTALEILNSFDLVTALNTFNNKNLAKTFLNESDIKILRHIEEITLGQTPYLSDTDYQNLLKQRQQQRLLLK